MRSLDSISFHSRWLMLALICCWMTWTWLHKNEVRAELRTYWIYRHPDEPCTLLSIGRIDKVYHQHRHPNKALVSLWGVPTGAFDDCVRRSSVSRAKREESMHSRFFEGKASRISQKDGVFIWSLIHTSSWRVSHVALHQIYVILTNLARCSLKEG